MTDGPPRETFGADAPAQRTVEIARGHIVVDAPRPQRMVGVIMAVLGVMTFCATSSDRFLQFAPLVSMALYFGGLVVAATARRGLERRVEEPGTGRDVLLLADDHLVVLTENGSWTVPARALTGARSRTRDRDLVLLSGHGTRVAVVVDDAAAADRLLATLRLDRGAQAISAARADAGTRAVDACVGGIVGVSLALLGMLSIVIGLNAFAPQVLPKHALFALLAGGLGPILFTIRWAGRLSSATRIVLGSDGVLVPTPRQGERFVAYEDVSSLEVVERAAILRTTSGEELIVTTSEPHLVAESIEAAREAAPPKSARVTRLARSSDALEHWQARLDGVAKEEGRYRVGQVDAQSLAAIVADPSASVDERAGAAYVLHTRGETDLLDGARIVVRRNANQTSRRSILAAANGDLEEFGAPEARATRTA